MAPAWHPPIRHASPARPFTYTFVVEVSLRRGHSRPRRTRHVWEVTKSNIHELHEQRVTYYIRKHEALSENIKTFKHMA